MRAGGETRGTDVEGLFRLRGFVGGWLVREREGSPEIGYHFWCHFVD